MLLRDLLAYAADRYPQHTAIVDGDRRYTYAEWHARVCRIARGLWDLGVRPGDRVLQLLKNREENCAIHFACQQIGAINTPLNFRWASEEIAYCVNDAEPKVIFFEGSTAEALARAQRQIKNKPYFISVDGSQVEACLYFNMLINNTEACPPNPPIDENAISLMLYTSGTTGRPKGVLRSQRAEYAATVGQIIQHRYTTGERTLGVMPLYHTMGMHSLTSMIALNGTFVAMPDWDPEEALNLIERERITCLYLVPTLYHMLLTCPKFAHYDTSSVRKISYAGAPMLSSLVTVCLEKFHPEVFINHYGSTELYTHSIYSEPWKKPGCAGRAAFHTQIRIVRPDPSTTVHPNETLPPGQIGEIIVRLTDEAFDGYYNRPEATARAIREGWYFTGDTGYIDTDGDLWVTGRVDDMIITGGENVYPVEIEDVLAQHPKVADVAVVGLPDETWGQIVTAFIVPRDPMIQPEELDAFCLASPTLARFKRPRKYVFVRQIPRSSTGKILRRLLVSGDYEVIAEGGQAS